MNIRIEKGNEDINSNGGILLIEKQLQLDAWKKVDALRPQRIKSGLFSHSALMKCIVLLLALGRSDFADIDQLRDDSLLKAVLCLGKVPSQETLRQRLNDFGLLNLDQRLVDGCVIEHLGGVKDFGKVRTQYAEYVPLDMDVSVMLQLSCSQRAGVQWTYHKANGYAPIFAYLGTHGYMLANEMREGSQHSAKGTIEFTGRTLEMAERIGLDREEILIRMDAAHDDGNFIRWLHERGLKFIIKRNFRQESPQQYLEAATSFGRKMPSREGKNVYRYILPHRTPKGLEDIPMFMIVEVTERLTDAKAQALGIEQKLIIPEVEVSTWWTNLPENEDDCIQLYHDHGTSEQYHSELKSDIGLENMPSGKFETNALILNLATLAFNCLRKIGQESLNCEEATTPVKTEVKRRRLRTVMQNLIHVGCKLTRHAHRSSSSSAGTTLGTTYSIGSMPAAKKQ